MQTTLRRRGLILTMLGLLLGVAVCHGRVFLHWNAASQSTRAMENAVGRIAYESSVTVNGGKGQLTVFSFEKSMTEVVRELSRLFNINNFNLSDGTMAMASIEADDRVSKLLALNLGKEGQTLVLKFEQSARDAKVSMESPMQHLMKAVPGYPGSRSVFYAKDDNTEMSMEMSSAQENESTIRDFYDSSLKGSGWEPALPVRTENAGLAVFRKGQEICCVFVDAADSSGNSTITVLHKLLQIK
jgi:hypothetical protein